MKKLRKTLRMLLPPAAVEAYQWMRGNGLSYYQGVYKSFAELPHIDDIFDSQAWVRHMFETLAQIRQEAQRGPVSLPSYDIPFYYLLATEFGAGPVRIVDFGGGLGLTYERLRHQFFHGIQWAYHVVEKSCVCEAGRREFSADASIRFHDHIPAPEEIGPVDIVYISSALQYATDYKDILKQLAGLRPAYFLLTRLSAGDIPTFLSVQHHLGHRSAYQFINLKDILAFFSEVEYDLILKCEDQLLRYRAFFPQEYRLERTLNLLFRTSKP